MPNSGAVTCKDCNGRGFIVDQGHQRICVCGGLGYEPASVAPAKPVVNANPLRAELQALVFAAKVITQKDGFKTKQDWARLTEAIMFAEEALKKV